jgi:hypothetical protein
MATDRRDFLRQSGLGLIAVGIGGSGPFLAPAAAHASGTYSFRVLEDGERATLAALGDVLLPGAVEEGFCEFIDYHLSLPAPDCLLMLRYLDVPPPYAAFYKGGLAALDALARARHDTPFTACGQEQQAALVSAMAAAPPTPWRGPPAPLFYFALRADAVDVYYGTERGFERLGVPYMAHITPEKPW